MKQRLTITTPMSPEQLPAVMAFARVVHHASFTRAAAELGVSASALSQTVRGLESRVGVRLLNRTTRRLAVTEEGERFLERVLPALELFHAAFEGLNAARGQPTGTLRLNVSRVATELYIEPMLGAFARAYPDITLDITVDDGLADLVGERFDAGIRLGERLAQDMVAVPISGPQRNAVVGAPEYFRRHGKPKTLAELRNHSCIQYRFRTSGALYRWEFAEDGKDVTVDVPGRFITNDVRVMIAAAHQGLGLVSLLESTVAADLSAGRLVRVLDAYCPPFPGFFLYYAHRAQMPLKLRVFIDFLKQRTAGRKKKK